MIQASCTCQSSGNCCSGGLLEPPACSATALAMSYCPGSSSEDVNLPLRLSAVSCTCCVL